MPEMKRRGFLKLLAGAPVIGPALLRGQDLSAVEVIASESVDLADIEWLPSDYRPAHVTGLVLSCGSEISDRPFYRIEDE